MAVCHFLVTCLLVSFKNHLLTHFLSTLVPVVTFGGKAIRAGDRSSILIPQVPALHTSSSHCLRWPWPLTSTVTSEILCSCDLGSDLSQVSYFKIFLIPSVFHWIVKTAYFTSVLIRFRFYTHSFINNLQLPCLPVPYLTQMVKPQARSKPTICLSIFLLLALCPRIHDHRSMCALRPAQQCPAFLCKFPFSLSKMTVEFSFSLLLPPAL